MNTISLKIRFKKLLIFKELIIENKEVVAVMMNRNEIVLYSEINFESLLQESTHHIGKSLLKGLEQGHLIFQNLNHTLMI